MIKFFRKIRQRLLTEYKFSNYLIYAIGEIFLVIIGILIALQINNINEESKRERQFLAVLNEVHLELGNNIKEADSLFMYFVRKDTLLNNARYPKIDFTTKKERNTFIDPLDYWNVFDIKSHRFQKLISNTNNIPPHFNSLVGDLQELFTNHKKYVDMANTNLESFVQDYHEWRKLNTNWYHYNTISHPDLSDDEIAFYFSDKSLYKNFVTHYSHCNNLLYESASGFRFQANSIYKELSSSLNLNRNKVESFGEKLTPDQINKIIGTYHFENYQISIRIKNNKLFWQLQTSNKTHEELEMIFFNKSHFSLDSPYEWLFSTVDYDSDNNSTSLTRRRGNYIRTGLKVNK